MLFLLCLYWILKRRHAIFLGVRIWWIHWYANTESTRCLKITQKRVSFSNSTFAVRRQKFEMRLFKGKFQTLCWDRHNPDHKSKVVKNIFIFKKKNNRFFHSASKAFFCQTSSDSDSSEPLKRVAASNSLSKTTRLGDCHTALVIMFSSSKSWLWSLISKGSTTVVKVPMVTLFFLTGKVALIPWELWMAKADPWGGGGGGGVDGSSLWFHSVPLMCMLRGIVLRTCVSTSTGEDDNLKRWYNSSGNVI